MKITPSQKARIQFLARVTDKECQHLLVAAARRCVAEAHRLLAMQTALPASKA